MFELIIEFLNSIIIFLTNLDIVVIVDILYYI